MYYTQIPATPCMAPVIRGFHQWLVPEPFARAMTHQVFGNACTGIGIIWAEQGPIRISHDRAEWIDLPPIFALLPHLEQMYIQHQGSFRVLFIELEPGYLVPFLDEPLDGAKKPLLQLPDELELSLRNLLTEPICPSNAAWANLVALLAPCIAKAKDLKNPLVLEAIHLLKQSEGQLQISQISQALHISRYHLDRLFHQYVGTSPKEYRKLLRIKRVLQRLRQAPGAKLGSLGLDCGYYDQSHFIREFNEITGLSPRQWTQKEMQSGKSKPDPSCVLA